MTSDEKQREFMELLDPAYRRLERFALSMTKDREAARDLVHDTILAAYINFENIQNKDAFVGYIFTIASNEFKRMYRRRKFFGLYNEEMAQEIPTHDAQPDVAADITLMREAMTKLPKQMREAVSLFEFSGLSLQEIQKIQGTSLSNIKARVTRGRRRLAKILGISDDATTIVEEE